MTVSLVIHPERWIESSTEQEDQRQKLQFPCTRTLIWRAPALTGLVGHGHPQQMMLKPVIDHSECEAGPTFVDGASGRIK